MTLKHWFIASIISSLMIGCSLETARQARPSSDGQTSVSSAVQPAAPSAQNESTPSEQVRVGTFVSGEHPTQGTVRLVTRNGQSVLELDESFQTSELGPDLVVILHRLPDVISLTQPPSYPIQAGGYVILAPLQKFNGAQSYPISASINVAEYQSAAIWCRKYNATFGAAVLEPVGNVTSMLHTRRDRQTNRTNLMLAYTP